MTEDTPSESPQGRLVRAFLEAHGYDSPVVVTRDGKQLTIIDGYERFKAGERSEEIDAIPVIVAKADD